MTDTLKLAQRFIASHPEAAEIVHQLIAERRMMGLTPTQRQALEFIRSFSEREGIMPTFDEIRIHLGLGSKSRVHTILTALEHRGHIDRLPGKVRAIRLK